MNNIKKLPLHTLGYNFIEPQYLPEGEDEYYLRNFQNRNGIAYRQLSAYEIEVLVRNRNTSDNWNNLLVSDAFNPELVKNCKFYGLVRIGKLEPYFLEFSRLRTPVGLYNSTIISCDFGDNVVIDNVDYLSHYIIGTEAMIINVNELLTTPIAKFGNGVLKDGEPESIRIWMELCNENAGRKVIPFNGMLPGDAWLWSKHRDNPRLLEQFKVFTEKKFDKLRGYYGKIGDRTVIKNCKIIKDVWIGSDAYLKGSNKIKNVWINSGPDAKSQIGEGCEIVNGIIGFNCRIFYGVKAVRFVMADNSQLKYGARLINSYLGNNATISCCEVLNSLIFPAHEQHHNNSFLCAAVVMGQSNIAAGATIGSNHNSRAADGEIVAGRGFWPGLCVSLKHNSKFASFTILTKGDYPAELNIPIPFSLVSNDVANDKLTVMPGYWFMYNMYALARNAWKYTDRDHRPDKTQFLEFDYLAPDTINEIFDTLRLLQLFTGRAYIKKERTGSFTDEEAITIGTKLLDGQQEIISELEVLGEGFENSKRKVCITKPQQSYLMFKEVIAYYGIIEAIHWMQRCGISTFEALIAQLPRSYKRTAWTNIGGQLMATDVVAKFIEKIELDKIDSWDGVHGFYNQQATSYAQQKLQHALASLQEITGKKLRQLDKAGWTALLQKAVPTREWMTRGIHDSRAKDYNSPFRKMVYETNEEMNKVMGRLSDNSFIKQENLALKVFKDELAALLKVF
ncbi:MAG: DUF4954 family protein [Chitinophagaceae bacterium]